MWLFPFVQVPPAKTLITPVQCKNLWRQFKMETEYSVTQAIAAQAWYYILVSRILNANLQLSIYSPKYEEPAWSEYWILFSPSVWLMENISGNAWSWQDKIHSGTVKRNAKTGRGLKNDYVHCIRKWVKSLVHRWRLATFQPEVRALSLSPIFRWAGLRIFCILLQA